MQLSDMQNRVLFRLRESGWSASGPPTGNGNFPLAMIAADLTTAQMQFLQDTGVAPQLTDKIASVPATATLDFALPTDLASLVRLEYQQAQQQPIGLRELTFDDFDDRTADGYLDSAIGGPPAFYRKPFAGAVRMWPVPSAGDVANGDEVIVYYRTLGATLTNPTDTPSLPQQFHIALVFRVLADYWRIKEGDAWATMYERDYAAQVKLAKAYGDDFDAAGQNSIGVEDDGPEYGFEAD